MIHPMNLNDEHLDDNPFVYTPLEPKTSARNGCMFILCFILCLIIFYLIENCHQG